MRLLMAINSKMENLSQKCLKKKKLNESNYNKLSLMMGA